MYKNTIYIIALLLFTATINAQDLELANHYFNKKAYVKAAGLFENQKKKTQEVYEKLGDCYYYNSEMDKAVKWYGDLMTMYESATTPFYYFKYAQALKGIKDYENAESWLEKYQKSLKADRNNFTNKSAIFLNEIENQKNLYTVYNLDFNTPEIDFGGAFYNKKLIFSSSRTGGKDYGWNEKPYLDLYEADVDDFGNLKNIEKFSSKINTVVHESNAVFTKDKKRIYFTRNNYINGKQSKDSKNITHLKIYSADFIDNDWTNIKELPFNSDSYSVMHPALSDDDKILYFSSDMPGTIGSFDLFEVSIEGKDSYTKPKNLGAKINTEQLEQFPFYSKDTLYFSSNGLLGFGGLDVFKSYKSKQGFTTPENLLLGINSNLDDFCYVLDEETSMGYISSNRDNGKGLDDIYRFKKALENIEFEGLVKERGQLNLIKGATVTLLDDNDRILQTLKTGEDGLFNFNLEPNKDYTIKTNHPLYKPETYKFNTNNGTNISKTILLDPLEKARIEGDVKEKGSLNSIKDATITLFDNNDNILEVLKTGENGSFNFNLEPNKEYTVKVRHKIYLPETFKFNTKDQLVVNKTFLLELYQSIDPNIVLKNDKVQIDHEPIYFDLNSSYIRADAIPILDHIVSVIKNHPDMNIHCASHTDSRADNKYNMWLSIRRAQKTAEYLISKGINASRITHEGYGESQLVNKCSDNVPCSEPEHQLNRRSEFVLE